MDRKNKATFSDEEIEEMLKVVDRQPMKYQSHKQLMADIGYTGNEKHVPIKMEIGKKIRAKGVLIDTVTGSFVIVTKDGNAVTSNQYDNAAIKLLGSLEQKNLKKYHNSDRNGIYGFVFSKPVTIKIERVKVAGIFHKYDFEVTP